MHNLRRLLLAMLLVPGLTNAHQSFANLFERTSASVVVLHTTETRVTPRQSRGTVSVPGLGSGVLISEDEILTAAHVVHAVDAVEVEFTGGTRIVGEVISSEPRADIALVRLQQPYIDARPAQLGDSDRSKVGDPVFLIGAPYGLGHTLTTGHISGRHRPETHLGNLERAEFFQTDAAINQGNSGGPMFNRHGEVIGIVSHILSTSGGSEGLGFAVTSNTANRLMLQQRAFYSGFDGYALTGDLARAFNIAHESGILIQRVAAGSFAQRLGLRAGTIPVEIGEEKVTIGGDIVVEVEGIPITGDDSLDRIRSTIQSLEVGDKLHVKVLRAGRLVDLSAYILI